MSARARQIVAPPPVDDFELDWLDLVDELQDEIKKPTDPTGAVAAWHTVKPRTLNGGRVAKSPTDDFSQDDR